MVEYEVKQFKMQVGAITMKKHFDDLIEGPRFQNRVRKRRKRLISLSIAIIAVILFFSVVNMFSDSSEETNGSIETTSDALEQEDQSINEDEEMTNETDSDEDIDVQEDPYTNINENKGQTDSGIQVNNNNWFEDQEATRLPSEEQINDGVDTGQTNQQVKHSTDFTKGSKDWIEMTAAVSVATGLPEDQMIIWWLGNGGSPTKAVSTVSTKDKQFYYRVQLEWNEQTGWKAVNVEEVDGTEIKPNNNG